MCNRETGTIITDKKIIAEKTFSIKKNDVGMSKPKKEANKVGMVLTQEVNVGPKIQQTTSI